MSDVLQGEYAGILDDGYAKPRWYSQYYINLESKLPASSFFKTSDGYFGLAPPMAQPGDQIQVVLGCSVPLILRARSDGNFCVVGHCYLQGYMEDVALLGPLPGGWRVAYREKVERGMWFLVEKIPLQPEMIHGLVLCHPSGSRRGTVMASYAGSTRTHKSIHGLIQGKRLKLLESEELT
jgi:hypothetical protein